VLRNKNKNKNKSPSRAPCLLPTISRSPTVPATGPPATRAGSTPTRLRAENLSGDRGSYATAPGRLTTRMASATVSWTPPGGGEPRVAQVPLPIADVAALRQRLAREFGLPGADFAITDTTKEALGDSDLAALRDGAALLVAYGGALAAPVRERISFQPHPKTLTMAGDYEYFAAQVRRRLEARAAGDARPRRLFLQPPPLNCTRPPPHPPSPHKSKSKPIPQPSTSRRAATPLSTRSPSSSTTRCARRAATATGRARSPSRSRRRARARRSAASSPSPTTAAA
jgi:hypothetical protein